MDALLRRWARFGAEGPVRTLVVVALVVLGAGWLAGGLEISTSRTALVSDDEPHWKRYMDFAREFGIPEDLVVVVEGASPERVRAAADAAAHAILQRRDQVGSVFHRIDLNQFSARAPLYLGYEQIQLVKRLASEPAVAALRAADNAPARLAAINEILKRAPAMWSEGTVPSDFDAMSAVLKGLFLEMRRFALKEGEAGAPTMELIDPRLLAEAVGNPLAGSGLDPSGFLTAEGGLLAVIFVRPLYHRDEMTVVLPFVKAVREEATRAMAAYPEVSFGLTGIPASIVDEQVAMQRDSLVTSLVALAGVVLLFLLYFPNVRLLVLSLAPVLVGVVITAAAAKLIYGYLNLISSVFLVILIGMGIDFSIHIAARFLEARREGQMPGDAAATAVERAGRGIITGGITSAGAFAAVGICRFQGVAELGVVAALGLMVTVAAAMLVLPALLVLAGPADIRTRAGLPGFELFSRALIAGRKPVMIMALVATVPCVWLMTHGRFDYSLLNLLPAEAESARLMTKMLDHRELSANAVVAVAGDLEAARSLEAKLAGQPSVLRAVSAATFLPRNQEGRIHQLREALGALKTNHAALDLEADDPAELGAELETMESRIERLQDLAFRRGQAKTVANLEEGLGAIREVIEAYEHGPTETLRARFEAFTATLLVYLEEGIGRLESTVDQGPMRAADLPAGVRERFVSASGRFAVYAFPGESIWDREALARFVAETRAAAGEVTGFPETFYENTEIMISGFAEAALYAALAVLVLLWLDLRSLRHVLFASLPLAVGVVGMLGLMQVYGLSYNLANIVGVPLIIGVGIDNAVHLIHRFREHGDLHETISRTGGAVMLSSLTTMVGFGALVVASHRGLQSLGAALFLGVGACLVATFTLLPALLGVRRS